MKASHEFSAPDGIFSLSTLSREDEKNVMTRADSNSDHFFLLLSVLSEKYLHCACRIVPARSGSEEVCAQP